MSVEQEKQEEHENVWLSYFPFQRHAEEPSVVQQCFASGVQRFNGHITERASFRVEALRPRLVIVSLDLSYKRFRFRPATRKS